MNFFNTLSENTDKVGGGSRLPASNETSAVIHYLQKYLLVNSVTCTCTFVVELFERFYTSELLLFMLYVMQRTKSRGLGEFHNSVNLSCRTY